MNFVCRREIGGRDAKCHGRWPGGMPANVFVVPGSGFSWETKKMQPWVIHSCGGDGGDRRQVFTNSQDVDSVKYREIRDKSRGVSLQNAGNNIADSLRHGTALATPTKAVVHDVTVGVLNCCAPAAQNGKHRAAAMLHRPFIGPQAACREHHIGNETQQ